MFLFKYINFNNGFNIFLLVLIFSGCCKLTKEDLKKKQPCKDFKGYHKLIYEPIIISEECNCIVMGKVKYLKNCETQVLIDFGDGTCDNIVTKIICEDGDCYNEHKEPIETYNFIIECNNNEIENGPLTSEEISELNSGSNFNP